MFAFCVVATGLPNGDSQIRAGAGKSEIVITTSARFDSADHGWELQLACFLDNSQAANAETFNPTEGCSRQDGVRPTSTSRLLEIAASGNHMRTRTQMAFWLAPSELMVGENLSPQKR